LTLDAQTVVIGATRIEAPRVVVTLGDGAVTLDPLSGRLYGGDLTGKAALTAADSATLQLSLSHGQLKTALADAIGVDLADGSIDAVLAVTANGPTMADWTRSLAGQGRLSVRDGHVTGFDLRSVDDRLRNPDGGLLGLLSAGLNGGKTAYTSLTGTVIVDKGVIVNQDLKLSADGGGADGAFRVDLPASTVDGQLAFHLAHAPDAPPLVLRVVGPLSSPRRFLDINPIQQWLARHVLTKGAKPKDILKSLFGK
jgi:AsmA protein